MWGLGVWGTSVTSEPLWEHSPTVPPQTSVPASATQRRFEQSDEGVQVLLRSGAPGAAGAGAPQRVAASYLAAADGASSGIR